MTPKQDKGYWRRWQAACKANGWREERGYLAAPELPSEGGSEPAQAVLTAAQIIADKHHRAITLADLRHAVHVAAIARDISHAKLNNKQISRVFIFLEMLANPVDLDALNRWANPEIEQQQREERLIRAVPEAFVQGVVKRMTREATADWRSLDGHDRRALIIILSNAKERWQRSVESAP